MKVKVMRIMGEEHMGAHYPPAPLGVESEIQRWLDDNPNASIEHASVSPMVHGLLDSGSGNIWPDSVLVTIFYSEEGVPGILRAMLIFGGIAAVGFTYLFGLENTWAHRLMVLSLAAVIGLVLFTIGALGHPFEGGARIGTGFFELVLKRMETSKLSDLR